MRSINSVCVGFIPDILLDCFEEGGDFPVHAFRCYAKVGDDILPRDCVEVLPAAQAEAIELGFGDRRLLCSRALWLHLPPHLAYQECRDICHTAMAFFRGWALGRLAGVPANV